MLSFTLTQWEAICESMESDRNAYCPLVADTCTWLRGLVADFKLAGRLTMELYAGGVDFDHVQKYCPIKGGG
jgi:hypothetical protein